MQVTSTGDLFSTWSFSFFFFCNRFLMQVYQILYTKVLFETKQCLVLIRFLILVSNLTFLDFVIVGDFVSKNFYPENGNFKTGFRQSAIRPIPHGTSGNIMFLSKSGLWNWIQILEPKSGFSPYPSPICVFFV